MKNQKPTFATQYPYLNHWIKEWGYMQIGNDYNFLEMHFLMLLDEGGTCYEGDATDTLEEAFEKAEKFLRTVEFPDRFDKPTIATLEAEYKNRD